MIRPRLAELLAAFALEHPHLALSRVTAIEFATWYGRRVRA